MALDSARQLLDELMGRARDIDPADKDNSVSEWSEPRICKFFLVNFCPNQLFTNTKADMGPCHKVHDDCIKRAYRDKASNEEKAAFEDEFVRFCQQTLSDVERRIKRAKQRLQASQHDKGDETAGGVTLSDDVQERMNDMSDKMDQLLEQIEELGCEGKVEEAQAMMKIVDKLKEDKATLKRDNMPMHWIQQRAEIGAAQEKQMEVCDVCGAFLIVNDVQQRVDDHLMGKQHVGFGKLKSALDEILEKRKNERGDMSDNQRQGARRWRSENNDHSRSKSKERDGDRNGRNSSNRGYGGGRGDGHNSNRRRDRDGSPSRRHRDRYQRSRSRSRDGSDRRLSTGQDKGSRRNDRSRGSPTNDRLSRRSRDK